LVRVRFVPKHEPAAPPTKPASSPGRLAAGKPAALPAQTALPLVKWAGGKRTLLRQLLALSPPQFSRFFEPFLGGGSFFLALASSQPIAQASLSDANSDLMQVYEAAKREPDALMAALDELQPHALDEQFYYRLRDGEATSDRNSERAARFIYLNKTCYNGLYRVNRRGRFNVPFGRYSRPPGLYNGANLRQVSALLQHAELTCADFAATLKDAGPGDFVYLDPPYVPLTATASFTRYTKGAFGDTDQRRLAQAVHELTARGCQVLLSNSETPLVRELYPSDRYAVTVVYAPRNINSDGASRQKIAELAIRNYTATRDERCGASAGGR